MVIVFKGYNWPIGFRVIVGGAVGVSETNYGIPMVVTSISWDVGPLQLWF